MLHKLIACDPVPVRHKQKSQPIGNLALFKATTHYTENCVTLLSTNIQYKISIKHTANCTLTNFGPHSGIVTTDNWRLYGYKSGSFLSNTGCYQVQSEFIQTGVLKSNSHVDADCQGTQFTSNVTVTENTTIKQQVSVPYLHVMGRVGG